MLPVDQLNAVKKLNFKQSEELYPSFNWAKYLVSVLDALFWCSIFCQSNNTSNPNEYIKMYCGKF